MADLRHARTETALGEVTLVAEDDALTGLYFRSHWYRPEEQAFGDPVEIDADPLLRQAREELDAYLSGERRTFEVPVRTAGDAFAELVWGLLREIPYGGTTTYGALAERLGDRSLAQRVGQAVGRNPLCVLIPCHRVVGSDGSLTGYAGGLRRKRFLLDLEEPADVAAARLF